eukprot:g79127.t1
MHLLTAHAVRPQTCANERCLNANDTVHIRRQRDRLTPRTNAVVACNESVRLAASKRSAVTTKYQSMQFVGLECGLLRAHLISSILSHLTSYLILSYNCLILSQLVRNRYKSIHSRKVKTEKNSE